MYMEIIPAIDIKNGKCVRLFKGDYSRETIYEIDPVVVAKKWQAQGATLLHVVDLDGAKKGEIVNSKTIQKIIKSVSIPIQVGGGIRSLTTIEDLIKIGVSRVILGTVVLEDKDLLSQAIKKFEDRIVISLDSKNGILMKKGWLEQTDEKILSTIQKLKMYGVRSFIFTDISKDGTLTEPDYVFIQTLINNRDSKLTVAGGISTIQQVKKLKEMNINSVIVGKALYEGKINLKEAVKLC